MLSIQSAQDASSASLLQGLLDNRSHQESSVKKELQTTTANMKQSFQIATSQAKDEAVASISQVVTESTQALSQVVQEHSAASTTTLQALDRDLNSMRNDITCAVLKTAQSLQASQHAALVSQHQHLLHSITEQMKPLDGIEAQLSRIVTTFETPEGTQSLRVRQRTRQGGFASGTKTTTNSAIRIDASLRPRCELTCKCQCHKRSLIKMPKLLQPIFGALSVNYNSIPVLQPRPCNSTLCKSNSLTSVQLQYYFPKWLISRGIHVAASWSSLTGYGASIHLETPFIISDSHRIWACINTGNITAIQHMFYENEIGPNCVSTLGVSLLLVCLRFTVPCLSRLWYQFEY
jgi:hypothetical protein